MHRPGIFHLCRQNLLGRDASPRDFSSLQKESPRQGCIAPGFFIPADRISSARMHRPRIFHLQTESSRQGCTTSAIMPPRLPDAPSPDKADSSDFQTAGFPDDLFYFLYLHGNKTFFAFPSNSSMYLSKSDINNLSCITRYFSNSVSA